MFLHILFLIWLIKIFDLPVYHKFNIINNINNFFINMYKSYNHLIRTLTLIIILVRNCIATDCFQCNGRNNTCVLGCEEQVLAWLAWPQLLLVENKGKLGIIFCSKIRSTKYFFDLTLTDFHCQKSSESFWPFLNLKHHIR